MSHEDGYEAQCRELDASLAAHRLALAFLGGDEQWGKAIDELGDDVQHLRAIVSFIIPRFVSDMIDLACADQSGIWERRQQHAQEVTEAVRSQLEKFITADMEQRESVEAHHQDFLAGERHRTEKGE
jgi:hypothetical protein